MSEHINIAPGSTVPKSGKYKCEFCGKGGIADMMGQMLSGSGLPTEQLKGIGQQQSVRFFEAGKKFTECPTCGPATGWTLVEESQDSVQPSRPQHDEVISESGVCDICTRKVSSPDGYLLTTKEVVSTPQYWQHYYQYHKSEFTSMGVSSYADFCRNPVIRASCGDALAGQRTAWMVCDNCISMFSVDREITRNYAKQWWKSKRTFSPPGTGSVPLSAINMGDARVMSSTTERKERISITPKKKWWEFWKK